jgi:hypothetical protein
MDNRVQLKDLPVFKLIKKKRYASYRFCELTIDSFGTRKEVYEKKPGCKSIDTLKLFYPKSERIITETNDLCQKCEVGYIIHHPVQFKDNTLHIQATCDQCHRFHCYISQDH